MLQTDTLFLSQKEQTTFNYLQRCIRNADQQAGKVFWDFAQDPLFHALKK